MKDNRRNFIKKITGVGAAALVVPKMVSALSQTDSLTLDSVVSKTILFQGDSITDGG